MRRAISARCGVSVSITVRNALNYASGTLSGGTWESVNGTLRLIGGDVTTNAATVLLDVTRTSSTT